MNKAAYAGRLMSTMRTLSGLAFMTLIFTLSARSFHMYETRSVTTMADVTSSESVGTRRYKVGYEFTVDTVKYSGSATLASKSTRIEVEYDPKNPRDNDQNQSSPQTMGAVGMGIATVGALVMIGSDAVMQSSNLIAATSATSTGAGAVAGAIRGAFR